MPVSIWRPAARSTSGPMMSRLTRRGSRRRIMDRPLLPARSAAAPSRAAAGRARAEHSPRHRQGRLAPRGGEPPGPGAVSDRPQVRHALSADGLGPGADDSHVFAEPFARLDPDDQPRAVYHGLAAVANDCDGEPPRFPVRPLPEASVSLAGRVGTLKRWFRQFIEVRDAEGAERCIASALPAGGQQRADGRHALRGGDRPSLHRHRPPARLHEQGPRGARRRRLEIRRRSITTLASAYASAERMEEANEWRHPIDLVAPLEEAFAKLPTAFEAGSFRRQAGHAPDAFIATLLSDDPRAILAACLMPCTRALAGRIGGTCGMGRRHADRAVPDEQRIP